MSSRHLKKVFGESQAQELNCDDISSGDEAPGPSRNSRKGKNKKFPAKSAFELLQDLSDTGDDVEAEAEEVPSDDDVDRDTPDPDEAQAQTPQHVKKKKSKKSRKRNKYESQAPASSSSSKPTPSHNETQTSNAKPKWTFAGPPVPVPPTTEREPGKNPSSRYRQYTELFTLDPKYLNPVFELKRIFGSKIITKEMSKERQRRYQDQIISAKEKWPTLSNSGISMIVLDSSEGFWSFKFEHSESYQRIQKQFMLAVNSHNPDNILAIVQFHPYHVDAQIQLSELAKRSEDSQMASEVIELALHAMEISVHSKFSMSSSFCRLPYRYQENRAFHILLYKHLTFVGLRACHRTALELCKRLITLDPDQDPLGASLMLDFYAIKAGECKWFLDYYEYWNPKRNLKQLPNFAFSVALSQFLLSIGAEGSTGVSSSTKSKTPTTNPLTEEEKSKLSQSADESLHYALLMFPLILHQLLDKCGVSTDSRVRNCDYFGLGAGRGASDSLKLLCNLYVWRSHHLWKDSKVLAWLERNVQEVLQKVEKKDPIIAEYSAQRSRRYLGTPRNILRHVLIADDQELTVYLPKEMAKETILNYDPLPPLDSVDIYKQQDLKNLQDEGTGERPGILSTLFRSLLDDLVRHGGNANNLRQLAIDEGLWLQGRNRPGQGEQVPGQAAGAEARGGGVGQGLNGHVQALLEAMRNLLTVTNREGGANDNASESDDDDELPEI